MPRLARNVFSNIPHHITQRGHRREDVFFSKEDRQFYLKWLGVYCQKWQVDILAYCLMSNHIHRPYPQNQRRFATKIKEVRLD